MNTIPKYAKGQALHWVAAVSGVAKDVTVTLHDAGFSAARGEVWYWMLPRMGAGFRAAERELHMSAAPRRARVR